METDRNPVKTKSRLSIFFVIFALLIGLVGGFFWAKKKYEKAQAIPFSVIREAHQNYTFINPLLAVDVPDQKDFAEFQPLEHNVQALIKNLQDQGKVDRVGFYFRDFSTGHWVGINEESKFFPASLLKVPLMIAYFKQAEDQRSDLLETKLVYNGKEDANAQELFKPSQNLQPGQSYAIEELIRRMIVYSDNNAANLLVNHIDDNSFREVYSDLAIDLPTAVDDNSNFLSPKQYSLFFRVLRNSTYLTREDSEKALQILSQAEFKNGLSAGLPGGTDFAHKFGEHEEAIGNQVLHELHDCGIVYVSGHPYLLCVMTEGKNGANLESSLKALSNMVYTEIIKN